MRAQQHLLGCDIWRAPFPIRMSLLQQRRASQNSLRPLWMAGPRIFHAAGIVNDDHRVRFSREKVFDLAKSLYGLAMKSEYDVVILGAGHNGLVAATYLARAGLSVLMLEKNDYIGGATTSQKVFPDYDAYLSRYSYLVSLFPEKIIRDLGLNLELRRRATASFTPYKQNGEHDGLLLSNVSEETSRQSILESDRKRHGTRTVEKVLRTCRAFSQRKPGTRCSSRSRRKQDFRRRFDDNDTIAKPGEVWWKNRSARRSNVI